MKDQINCKKIIVTCALPYANGSIHLGHLLEHIQADIWVRYQRMCGNIVYFICADDAHGTAIMLKAKELKIKPEIMINKINQEHQDDFQKFNINHDSYESTHNEENRIFLESIYFNLKKKGLIEKHTISQLYDPQKKMFLPDRFIKGICPKCQAVDQYGDTCEVCGSIYNAIDLIQPKSTISNVKLEIRLSEHLFFDLPTFSQNLKIWIDTNLSNIKVKKKLYEWFDQGLKKWNISRDFPYFGFKIPDQPNKYFYVWLDAPIGYMSSFQSLSNKNKINFDEFWEKNSTTELYHFIGKDIIYFHGLFWPAILEANDFRKPNDLFVHGFLNVNGKKMSKSKGTFIQAKTWLKYLDSDSLRYYFSSKLSSTIEDINLNFDDFLQKINSDIVNKIINLASRVSFFIEKKFFGQLSSKLDNINFYNKFCKNIDIVKKYFENREYSNVIKKIIHLSTIANCYIDEKKPWVLAKQNNLITLQEVCSMGINLFKIIITLLKPIIPMITKKVEYFLNKDLNFYDIKKPLLNHKILSFKHLYNRIEKKQIDFLLKDLKIF
ncbi:methionine--tRNA ligase [Candidatus Tachikawaea gelatinosa]|uniref:Methionine--tRNA ligase n=1 Tax=Candidatus Tachikawaea gelatinosa TaxID=1410383 RepID=A0A090APZ7_9ENTR|nr:methionine--tRNA ligase [Candidatus Tachikawaea gelatinosa]BAP58377.1 methionine--tRNA ligase [Candidatus Tachikawaea gelatinosa]